MSGLISGLMRLILLAVFVLSAEAAAAESLWSPDELAQQIFERPASAGRSGVMHFALENRRGHRRERAARMFYADASTETKVAIYFTEPRAIAETAFLSIDRNPESAKTTVDENWLYLPATQRVRRLPSSERGDHFMGTDLTYGDIKDNFKFAPEDWSFSSCSDTSLKGFAADETLPCLEGEAASPDIARELGYGGFVATVDPLTLFPQQVRYFDLAGQVLKDIVLEKQENIGGAWTAMAFRLSNMQTGHSTRVHFTEMQSHTALPGQVFDAAELEFGVPEVTAAVEVNE